MTCPAHLHDGPLTCTLPAGHIFGHVFQSCDVDDMHTTSEATND